MRTLLFVALMGSVLSARQDVPDDFYAPTLGGFRTIEVAIAYKPKNSSGPTFSEVKRCAENALAANDVNAVMMEEPYGNAAFSEKSLRLVVNVQTGGIEGGRALHHEMVFTMQEAVISATGRKAFVFPYTDFAYGYTGRAAIVEEVLKSVDELIDTFCERYKHGQGKQTKTLSERVVN